MQHGQLKDKGWSDHLPLGIVSQASSWWVSRSNLGEQHLYSHFVESNFDWMLCCFGTLSHEPAGKVCILLKP